jgi:hypothetical protein
VSPATPFSDVSLPNHTKKFEHVLEVTSMDDFAEIHISHSIKTEFNGDYRQLSSRDI